MDRPHVPACSCAISIVIAAMVVGSMCLTLAPRTAAARELIIRSQRQLYIVLKTVKPGRTLKIDPGRYRGGMYLRDLAGTKDQPIIITGADPKNPPIFQGPSNEALHLGDCRYLVLRNLVIRGYRINGMNIDDGGSYDTPAHHVVIENCRFEDIGPKGNHDGLKMSGVDYFTIRNCTFAGWGGSAIDMVGCHHGVIENCRFLGREGFSQANAVQLKGGSRHVLVQQNFFHHAGERAINLGGSTEVKYFRPAAKDYEAKDIVIAGNRFVGSMSAVAWTTADGGLVHHNTIYMPTRWVVRALQETADSQFRPSHSGVFERNLIVFDKQVRTTMNIGPRTAPKTFTFRNNAWFRTDGTVRLQLPVEETGGVIGVDPKLADAGKETMRATSDDPRLKDIGARAYRPPAHADRPDGKDTPNRLPAAD